VYFEAKKKFLVGQKKLNNSHHIHTSSNRNNTFYVYNNISPHAVMGEELRAMRSMYKDDGDKGTHRYSGVDVALIYFT